MKTTHPILALCAALALSGCATPYQSEGFTGGYTDTQLAPDVFRVVYRGNGYTREERAQDFALLRASELALQHGFTCFAVVDEHNSTSVSSFTTPGSAQTTAFGTGSGYVQANTTYMPPQTHFFYKPRTGLLVRAFQTRPDGVFTFDAAFLVQSLKQKYGIQ